MKKFWIIVFKIFIWGLILSCAAILSFYGAKKIGWPIWGSLIIFTGFIGLILLVLFLKKYLLRKRERKFIERILTRDRAAIETAPEIKRLKLLELQEHWKESVKKLQESHLKKLGNPLYVLPWFMVLGESKNGKTSAIKNAHITSALTEISRAAGISGTRNCDWWFCKEAIILDTAGRYSIPIEDGPDLEEWKEFLKLLAEYRKKEPLNGVIVVVSADNLLERDGDSLKEIGQSIRLRIDQLMRITGAKFPVYVMVTKMDLVHGFTHFAELLPEETLNQAMGYTNQKFNISFNEILEDCQRKLLQRLNELRFLLVNKHKNVSPGAIMFPVEFERLFPKLKFYLEGLFEENQYQETPLFRGIYFSSALVKGSPVSDFLKLTKIKNIDNRTTKTNKGIFLKDFFQKILPKDRTLFTPITEFLKWKNVVNNLGVMFYLFLLICFGGAITLSFLNNYNIMKRFEASFDYLPQLTNDKVANLLLLDKMRLVLLELDAKNRDWFIPRFGLNQSLELQDRLQKHYCFLFHKGFLEPIDTDFKKIVSNVTPNIPVQEFIDLIGFAVVRASVLREILKGKLDTSKEYFVKFTKAVFNITEEDKEIATLPKKFATNYYFYLKLNKNNINFLEKLKNYEQLIVYLLNKKGKDLFWLVDNTIANAPGIHLNDFWQEDFIGSIKNIYFVPGAFTNKGRENIQKFISLIENSITDENIQKKFKKNVDNFWKWYVIEFYNSWYSFIKNFNKGIERIENLTAWQKLASSMTTTYNPYFLFMKKFYNELSSLDTRGLTPPPWVNEFNHIYRVIKEAKILRDKKKGSLIDSLKTKEQKITEKIEKEIDKKIAEKKLKIIEQARAWNDYINALKNIDLGTLSIEDAYKLYSECFKTSANTLNGNGLIDAYKKYYKFRNLMTYNRFEYTNIYDLAFGPLGFLVIFASKGAACYIQEKWEEIVLSVVNDVDPYRLNDVLFDKNEGVVWKFINEVANPFLGKNSTGYFVRKAFIKQSIPFNREFLTFLNKGKIYSLNKKNTYNLTIKTVPITVNSNAKVEPYYSSLTVTCSKGAYILENYNFPNKINITWSPESCGDVIIVIKFPDYVLTKKYTGKFGLAKFLKDFRSGTKIFYPKDFPESKNYFNINDISWIKLSFIFQGDFLDIVNLTTTITKEIPQNIVECQLK